MHHSYLAHDILNKLGTNRPILMKSAPEALALHFHVGSKADQRMINRVFKNLKRVAGNSVFYFSDPIIWLIYLFIRFILFIIYSLTNSVIHLFILHQPQSRWKNVLQGISVFSSSIHLFIHSIIASIIDLLFIHSLLHAFIHLFIFSFIHLPSYSLNHSFINSIMRPFIRSFIQGNKCNPNT